MEDTPIKGTEEEIQAELERFKLHIRSFEVLNDRIGKNAINEIMVKVRKKKAGNLAEKMDGISLETLSYRMSINVRVAKGVLKVIANDENMCAETMKGLLRSIIKLGYSDTRFDFPETGHKADFEALKLLHSIEDIDFADVCERGVLDFLETGSEGDEAQSIARSIREAQAVIAKTPDLASKRFDELLTAGVGCERDSILIGRLK